MRHRNEINVTDEEIETSRIEPFLKRLVFILIGGLMAAYPINAGRLRIGQEHLGGACYRYFPDVPNIISYLAIEKESVIALSDSSEGKERLSFAAFVPEESGDAERACLDYVNALTAAGYRLTKTTDESESMFALENERYQISIRITADLVTFQQFLPQKHGISESGETVRLLSKCNLIFEIIRK